MGATMVVRALGSLFFLVGGLSALEATVEYELLGAYCPWGDDGCTSAWELIALRGELAVPGGDGSSWELLALGGRRWLYGLLGAFCS